jgi:hypothetical protein
MPDHLVIIEIFEKLTSQCHFQNYGSFSTIAKFYLRIISWVLYCVLWPTEADGRALAHNTIRYVQIRTIVSHFEQLIFVPCWAACCRRWGERRREPCGRTRTKFMYLLADARDVHMTRRNALATYECAGDVRMRSRRMNALATYEWGFTVGTIRTIDSLSLRT